MVSITPLAMTRRTPKGQPAGLPVRAGLGEPAGLERLGDAMFRRHYPASPAAPETGAPNHVGLR